MIWSLKCASVEDNDTKRWFNRKNNFRRYLIFSSKIMKSGGFRSYFDLIPMILAPWSLNINVVKTETWILEQIIQNTWKLSQGDNNKGRGPRTRIVERIGSYCVIVERTHSRCMFNERTHSRCIFFHWTHSRCMFFHGTRFASSKRHTLVARWPTRKH